MHTQSRLFALFLLFPLVTPATARSCCRPPQGYSFGSFPFEPAQPTLELAAEQIKCFSAGDVTYNRLPDVLVSGDFTEQLIAAWRPVFETRFHPGELLELLGHQDPRVRTLAAARLFQENQPRQLLHLLPLLEDGAETFPQPRWQSYAGGETLPEQPPTRPQTVGDVVRTLTGFYSKRLRKWESSSEYWARRAEREYCLSWFEVRLDRIPRGQDTPRYDQWSLSYLRREIEALPPVDRDWTLLAIFHWRRGHSSDVVTSDRELAYRLGLVHQSKFLFAARRRGRAALLEVLRGKAPTDDPDWPAYLERVRNFILVHAAELLRPGDADELLRLAAEVSEYDAAPWYVASARLAPEDAFEILEAGLARTPRNAHAQLEQLMLAQELSTLDDPRAADRLVEWFFDEGVKGGVPPRVRLVELLAERWQAEDRWQFHRFLDDPRTEALDEQTLAALALALNQNSSEPIVDPARRGRIPPLSASELLERWRERSGGAIPLPVHGANVYPIQVVSPSGHPVEGVTIVEGEPLNRSFAFATDAGGRATAHGGSGTRNLHLFYEGTILATLDLETLSPTVRNIIVVPPPWPPRSSSSPESKIARYWGIWEDPITTMSWHESAVSASPRRCVVDLNDDGREDQIISVPVRATSEGVRHHDVFLQRDDGQYGKIGRIRASAFALEHHEGRTVLWYRCESGSSRGSIGFAYVDLSGHLQAGAPLWIRHGEYGSDLCNRILAAIFTPEALLHFEEVEISSGR